VFLVLGVLGWILSTLDASLQELQAEGAGPGAPARPGIPGIRAPRAAGLKHRKAT
jgi:hypothetical protein